MLFILLSIYIFLCVVFLLSYSILSGTSRFQSVNSSFSVALSSLVESNVAKLSLSLLFVLIAFSNVLGNVPGVYTPTQYYSVVMWVSATFWAPILICATLTDFKGFFAHMFPKGAPLLLIILLPLVEFVSIMLRPLILVVRLATNLAAGHILLYIFAYFASLLPSASLALGILLAVLYIIEFFISILQAYIFVSLLSLYIADTL